MTPEDDPLFAQAGATLGTPTAAERARDHEHAQVVHGMVTAARRRMHRRAHQRRIAFRAAAGVAFAAVVLVLGRSATTDRGHAPDATVRDITFRFDDARAVRVSVVGEFNSWNPQSTPMARTNDGRWTARITVPPGRHTYAFVVNDTTWIADPTAPRAPERWFGDPRSVLVVASSQ